MTEPAPAKRAKPVPTRVPTVILGTFYALGCAVMLLLLASLAVGIYRDLTPQPVRTVCVYVDGAGIAATETVTVDGRCYGLDAP